MSRYAGLNLPTFNSDATIMARAHQPESLEPVNWVFIIGLHRSGTTFLQQCLTDHFNLISPTVYHLLYYETLLHNAQNGNEAADKERLKAYFQSQGLTTRLVDNIALTPDTCEEVGFLLARLSGSLQTTDDNYGILNQLGEKLKRLTPQSDGVLIKNPWDTRNAPQLSQWFPNARFIFIKRDRQAILNSQLANAMHYGSERDPYLDLLIKDIPALKRLFALQKSIYRVLPRPLYRRLFYKLLSKDIDQETQHYQASLARMPSHRCIEIDYSDLVVDTLNTFETLQQFLQLQPTKPLGDIVAQPRGGESAAHSLRV